MAQQNNQTLKILMYIFKHHVHSNQQTELSEQTLLKELDHAGYSPKHAGQAIDWLKGLITLQNHLHMESACPRKHKHPLRIYSDLEKQLIPQSCRSYIAHLEHIHILGPTSREMVIDRLAALHTQGIDIPLVKWVTLMVLFNQDRDSGLKYMEFITLLDHKDYLQ